jgi:hypothetical protein
MKVLFWIIIIIALAPTLFFPYAPDLSIFMEGGKAILEGRLIYRDFLDLKPPAIYYIYAFINFIFGSNEFAPRIFDYIYQMVAIFLLIRLLKNNSAGEATSYLAGVLFAFTYTSLNFNQTAQTESLATIPVIIVIAVQASRTNKNMSMLLRGAMIGLITGIKFTMGILLLAVIADDLMCSQYKAKSLIKNWALTLGGFLGALFITLLPLLHSEIWHEYKNVLEYLAVYSSLSPMDSGLVRHGLKKIALFFGDSYSLLLSSSFVAAPVFVLGKLTDRNQRLAGFVMICITLSLFFLFSIVVERKFHEYHYLRMFVPIIALSAIGLARFIAIFKEAFSEKGIYTRIIIIMITAAGLLFSPLPRWVNLSRLPLYHIASQEKYDNFFERPGSAMIARVQQKRIATYINRNGREGDKVTIVSTGSFPLMSMLEDKELCKFTQSAFVLGKYSSQQWYEEFKEDIYSSDWIIIQRNDLHPQITGHNMTSWQALKKRKALLKYVLDNFDRKYETNNYLLFKRKPDR